MAGAEGFEPSLTVLETGLLPLTICPYKYMGRITGIEPAHNGATIRRVNHFTICAMYMIKRVFARAINIIHNLNDL